MVNQQREVGLPRKLALQDKAQHLPFECPNISGRNTNLRVKSLNGMRVSVGLKFIGPSLDILKNSVKLVSFILQLRILRSKPQAQKK
ncbi:hypothetical protein D3C75_1117560 [compost metagenome]